MTAGFATDFDRLSKRESIRWDSMAASSPDQSDASFRMQIKKCDQADELLAVLQKHFAAKTLEVDNAEREHADTCQVIDEELNNPATTVERRLELRTARRVANDKLLAVTEPMKEIFASIKDEIEATRCVCGRRQAIENSFVNSDTEERKLRVRILRKAAEQVGHLSSAWQRQSSDAGMMVLNEKERRKKDNRTKYDMSELELAEKLADGVSRLITDFERQISAEINQIRETRLAKLYAE